MLGTLSRADLAALTVYWPFWARPEQRPPQDRDWHTWLYLGGRGAGKTRSGAEWVREQAIKGYSRIALVAPTAADARMVMVQGESGLLSVCQEDDYTVDGHHLGRPSYEPSKRSVTWANGANCVTFSAEEPERLRGPQFEKAWADELAAWKYRTETWDMLMFTLRLGDEPQVVITTTPKPFPLLKEILAESQTVKSVGSTFSNIANLSPQFIKHVRERYEGTSLGRQELYAEILSEAEGALWTRKMIEDNRVADPPEYDRIVVSVDPAVTKHSTSAEHGIVVTARSGGHCYVLQDASGRMSPEQMGKTAIRLYKFWRADRIVAETNNGGDMVETIIRNIDPLVSYRSVWASVGKRARAEPVSALYEQRKVHHVGVHPDLEEQMCTWEPLSGDRSPDRLDAMVWGVTDQLLDNSYDPTAGV